MLDDPKYQELTSFLKKLGKTAVAFSGGVDSTFLLAAAKEAIGDVVGITVDSPALPRRELRDAVSFARSIGVRHVILRFDEIEESVRKNPVRRCYFCKKEEFGNIIKEAERLGYAHVLDGSNADDIGDYRPGMKASRELKVISPLQQIGITKKEVRNFAKALGLSVWDKPAYACLYSRFPYGTEIRKEDLEKVEKAEEFLLDRGFHNVRVRFHGEVARIEVDSQERERLLRDPFDSEITKAFRSFGFRYITVDIQGYRMGSLNESLKGSVSDREKA
jgi:pyridinium-3,5-biscarboxylic acid mononucleotide sulfurtransferase